MVDDVDVDGVVVAEGDVRVDGRESGDGCGERPGPDHGLGPGVLWTVSNASGANVSVLDGPLERTNVWRTRISTSARSIWAGRELDDSDSI